MRKKIRRAGNLKHFLRLARVEIPKHHRATDLLHCFGHPSRFGDRNNVVVGSLTPNSTQTHWFTLIYLPVIPLGRYRVKKVTPSRYLSRKLAA